MRIASPLFSPKVYTKGEKKSVSHVNLQMDKADPPGGEGKGERRERGEKAEENYANWGQD